MYRKKKYRQKRKKRGRGVLLGSDWSKIYRNLQPYLQKKKQRGGDLFSWIGNQFTNPNSRTSKFARWLNNPRI